MVTKELIDYIQKELRKNTPIDAIHGMLKKHHWGDAAINEGLRLALQDRTLLSKTLHLNNDDAVYDFPKSLELLKLALTEYKQRFKLYTLIASLPTIISLLVQLVTKSIGVNPIELERSIAGNWLLLGVILMWVVIFIVFFSVVQLFAFAAFIVALRDRYTNPSLKESYKQGARYVWPLMLVGFLVGLWVVFGLIIFLVPALLFALWYGFSGFVVVDSGLRGRQALKQSKSLVKGRWWKIYWRLFFICFVTLCLQTAGSLVLGKIPLPYVKEIGQSLLGLAVTSISTIYIYFLYEKLKKLV